MRNWINLTESLSRWRDETLDDPEHGAGDPIGPEDAPSILYHGTNPIAAAAILRKGMIAAEHPVDDDDLGPVVCITSSAQMARNFATEFTRLNSEYDVGVVFGIDGKKLTAQHKVIPYHAETAGVFEYEYRVIGNIDLSLCVTKVVGAKRRLSSEKFRETLWSDAYDNGLVHHFSQGQDDFNHWLDVLIQK